MCVGWEESRRTSAVVPRRTSAVVPSRPPQPVPDSDAVSDIVIFSSSHHSWATHVSDTQPSRVLDTPHEDSQDNMATLDWDAGYEMHGDEGEGFDLPNRRSTTTDTSQREVSHPRMLRNTTARLARSSVTHTPPTSSLPRPSPTYAPDPHNPPRRPHPSGGLTPPSTVSSHLGTCPRSTSRCQDPQRGVCWMCGAPC